jgi:pimeloyl-ACP methyl ester carboxylesterase
LAGHLDLHHIAVMGHSLGGIAALAAVSRDPRISTAMVMDAPVSASSLVATDKPVLILAAGRDEWGRSDCQLWRSLRGVRLLILRLAVHKHRNSKRNHKSQCCDKYVGERFGMPLGQLR